MGADDSTVRIAVPSGWERLHHPVAGVPLVMAARRRPASGVLPSMAVAVAELGSGWSRAGYLGGLRDELICGLDGGVVEDDDAVELDTGEVSYLRVAHRSGEAELVSEVWVWLCGGRAWSVSGTVDRRDYADYCDVFEGVAETFDPESSRPR